MNKDTRDLLALVAAEPDGEHTLATVVAVAGSSYRRPGARLLVHAAGLVAGSVSGGCLERDLVRRGRFWAEAGPTVRQFTTAADRDEAELHHLGCGGTIDVLVENVAAKDATGPLALLRWIREQRAPACLVTVVRGTDALPVGSRVAATASAHHPGAGGGALRDLCASDLQDALCNRRSRRQSYLRDGAAIDVFLEYLPPPRELLVAGRHHDVAPLVRMARLLGWDATVAASGVAPRALGDPDDVIALTPEAVARWARARAGVAVVVMTHSLALDRQILAAVLARATPAYLGLLGPQQRARDILDELAATGASWPAGTLAALRAPVGLDLGGDGPEAIALSIVADIQATLSERAGSRLCEPGAWKLAEAAA